MTTQLTTQTTAARKAVALLCLALFLFLQALVTVPGLHRHLHHDADQADHQCAVTLLSHGSFHAPASGLAEVTLPCFCFFTIILPCDSAPGTVDYLLLPVRGPPSLVG